MLWIEKCALPFSVKGASALDVTALFSREHSPYASMPRPKTSKALRQRLIVSGAEKLHYALPLGNRRCPKFHPSRPRGLSRRKSRHWLQARCLFSWCNKMPAIVTISSSNGKSTLTNVTRTARLETSPNPRRIIIVPQLKPAGRKRIF